MSRMAATEARRLVVPGAQPAAVHGLRGAAGAGGPFTSWELFTPPHFAGLQNYTSLILHDPLFHKVLGNAVLYVLGTVPLQMLLALGVALLLNRGSGVRPPCGSSTSCRWYPARWRWRWCGRGSSTATSGC